MCVPRVRGQRLCARLGGISLYQQHTQEQNLGQRGLPSSKMFLWIRWAWIWPAQAINIPILSIPPEGGGHVDM